MEDEDRAHERWVVFHRGEQERFRIFNETEQERFRIFNETEQERLRVQRKVVEMQQEKKKMEHAEAMKKLDLEFQKADLDLNRPLVYSETTPPRAPIGKRSRYTPPPPTSSVARRLFD